MKQLRTEEIGASAQRYRYDHRQDHTIDQYPVHTFFLPGTVVLTGEAHTRLGNGIHRHEQESKDIIGRRIACHGDEVKKMLSDGAKPDEIINNSLIPAINEVGELFNQKKYFLPQLIGSANTMKLAIEHLEPLLEKKDSGDDMPTLVIATVEGDIHDIGKNLVVLMLKNYGYNVIDMGKDVPCEDIVNKAIETNAAVIGLSALMTTTMMRMKDVVEICKEKGCKSKVVIGGACITQSFADEIGADGYSKDAAECVKLVERLLNS